MWYIFMQRNFTKRISSNITISLTKFFTLNLDSYYIESKETKNNLNGYNSTFSIEQRCLTIIKRIHLLVISYPVKRNNL